MDLMGTINATKLLMKCLAKAMDDVYTEELGADWFQAFFEDDQQQVEWKRICHFDNNRGRFPQKVTEFDFQAFIKVLSFRKMYADLLFEHYPISTSSDPAIIDKERKRLEALLTRLRRDFRNSSFAHISLESVLEEEQVENVQTLYSFDEVVQDIKTLARIFRDVRDERGRSYYDLISEAAAKDVLADHKIPRVTPDPKNAEVRSSASMTAGSAAPQQQNPPQTKKHGRTVAIALSVTLAVVVLVASVTVVVAGGGTALLWASLSGKSSDDPADNATQHITVFGEYDFSKGIDEYSGRAEKIYVNQTKDVFCPDVADGSRLYCTNPSVLEINEDGTIRGVHRGEAFVIILSGDATTYGVEKVVVMGS